MFSTMKVSELKLELKKLGLKSSGRKHELISRLSGDTQQPTKRVKVQAPVSVVDTAQYVTFFQQYADEDNEMLGEGITKFCADLQVDPEDIVLLILSWYMGAETMCVFTQDEFVKGMMAIRCTTIAQLSARLHEIRNMALNQNEQFMKIYHYAFDFGKEISQRSMAVRETHRVENHDDKTDQVGGDGFSSMGTYVAREVFLFKGMVGICKGKKNRLMHNSSNNIILLGKSNTNNHARCMETNFRIC